MERETLLTLLVLLFGGLALQPLALLPWRPLPHETARAAERRAWLRLWWPVIPTLLVGAWLCGWAWSEPDPVRESVDSGLLLVASLPFALVVLRAVLRAAWSLLRRPAELPICTTGLWRPRVVLDPFFARALGEGPLRAALEHERAHARHRDPLRLWLGQLATDLQWPWAGAPRRFDAWLEVLECARDDEARGRGASGADLAAAVLAVARQPSLARRAGSVGGGGVALLRDGRSLQRRIVRLLGPEPSAPVVRTARASGIVMAIALTLAALSAAIALGVVYGELVLHSFFVWTWLI